MTEEQVHGSTYLGLHLAAVLATIYTWLDQHPTEAVFIQIKRDVKCKGCHVHFAHAVTTVIAQGSAYWRTSNTTPALGSLRGRIQLFRRFIGPTLDAYGIDVTQWLDNPPRPFTITGPGHHITIQDHYSFPDCDSLGALLAAKGGAVSGLLHRADTDPDPRSWYVNFTSAFEFTLYRQFSPRAVALGGWWRFRWHTGMNRRLRAFLAQRDGRPARLGVILMDFPDQGAVDLIAALIETNFEGAKGAGARRSRWWRAVFVVLLLCGVVVRLLGGRWIDGPAGSRVPSSPLMDCSARNCADSRGLL